MERSRYKRFYHDLDYDLKTFNSRTKPRYNNSVVGGGGQNYAPSYHRRSSAGGGGAGGRCSLDPLLMLTTSYRILCKEVIIGSVIGKSGSVIKAIEEHMGAWINVHELIPGDEERIIEICDKQRRDLEGGMPELNPVQGALFLIHDRILETGVAGGGGYGHNVGFRDNENVEFGPQGGGGNNGNKVMTRLVVPRMHVGSLLGKGGKIMEQMKIETSTYIRILPRDRNFPLCVAMSEEIVQVVGDMNAVKDAIRIISTRLRENQHRYRNHFHNRLHSPRHLSPTDDAFIPHTSSTARRSSVEGSNLGSRFSAGSKSNINSSRSSGYAFESGTAPLADNAQCLVFRILCPADKVDSVVGESGGIVDLLQNEVGVDVMVADPVSGTDELIITISSDEGLDNELFPAQEALLHIQTCIVYLVPEKENIITTRLLLQSEEAGCLKSGSLPEMRKITGANIQILPRGDILPGVSGSNEIVQIVGEIRAAREALIVVTSRVRSYMYQEFLKKDLPPPSVSSTSPMEGVVKPKADCSKKITSLETHAGNSPAISTQKNTPTAAVAQQVKDVWGFRNETVKQNNSEFREDTLIALNRISVPLVTKHTLEVVIPPNAASKLVKKSRNMLTSISQLSGANVELIENRPEVAEKIIQITGTIEQSERAQSLLQGFILSTEEDGP
ncbi:RNA-binding KH domain-containing protein [Forsythia ovata]|uniref:RNA-binding KH domain-containing protein n=1 Tax=Forsythia ovata TaxID=205694 RepID=A0ABD1WM72_9LAMI